MNGVHTFQAEISELYKIHLGMVVINQKIFMEV